MGKPGITQSEIVIMNIIWEKKEASLRMIMDAVCDKTGWSKHTIISFLKRMEQKNLIKIVSTSPVKKYTSLIDKETTLRKKTKSIINNVYNGSIGLLVSNLVSANDMTDKEIAELITILESNKAKNE